VSTTVAAMAQASLEELKADVREAHSAMRESDEQVIKSENRAEAARAARALRRIEFGRALARLRIAWPERGPRSKGWGEFLVAEGIEQSTAWRWMDEAGYKSLSAEGREAQAREAAAATESEPDVEASSESGETDGDRAHRPTYGGADTRGLSCSPHENPAAIRLGFDLRVGRWEDVLAGIGMVDVVITDAPFSERVHESKPTRDDGVDPAGLSPSYDHWTAADIERFVEHWSPRCRGWMVGLCDDELIPAWRAAYRRMDRVDFAPVPCVITGMTVRTRGDGPSSWAVYAMVARPRGATFASWGTTPGAYVGSAQPGAENGRGKPLWLTDSLVKDYSRGNDLVCDPLAGYGGTLISALSQRRRAVGAELDEAAHQEAMTRSIAPAAIEEEQETAA